MIRRAMTAVELMIVLAIVGILIALVVPAWLDASRASAVRDGAASIIDVWRQAQGLAQNGPGPGHDGQRHWGVLIYQSGGQAWVGLVHDDSAITSAPESLRQYRPLAGGLPVNDSTLPPVMRLPLGSNTRIMIDPSGTDSWEALDGALLWYAQYRSGRPIAASSVAALAGRACSPIGVGVGITQGAEFGLQMLAPGLRVQTLDFAPEQQGHAQAIQVYPAGVALFIKQH